MQTREAKFRSQNLNWVSVLPQPFGKMSDDELWQLPEEIALKLRGCSENWWKAYVRAQNPVQETTPAPRQPELPLAEELDEFTFHTNDGSLFKKHWTQLTKLQRERRKKLLRNGVLKGHPEFAHLHDRFHHEKNQKIAQKITGTKERAKASRKRLPSELAFELTDSGSPIIADYLAYMISSKERYQISITELARRCRIGRSTVQRGINRLLELGVISKVVQRMGKVMAENTYNIVGKYREILLQYRGHWIGEMTSKMSREGRFKNEPDSKTINPSDDTCMENGDDLKSNCVAKSSSLNENSRNDPKSRTKVKCNLSSDEDLEGNPQPKQQKINISHMFADPAKDVAALAVARNACKMIDPEKGRPVTWEAIYARCLELWETYVPNLDKRIWDITGRAKGEKLRALIMIETALMQKFGYIHTTAPGFFCGIAKKTIDEVMPHVTISRFMMVREGWRQGLN
ncbi:MAG: hypothetical protein ACNI26_15785 [Terasakiella sp.]|uniref:hypothetical protein n=2 Tax=Terasakiella TaxID=196080 RepID=UPI003B00337D